LTSQVSGVVSGAMDKNLTIEDQFNHGCAVG